MKLNPKLTGGLAWAGLIVILAVPSADMLTKTGGSASTITSDTDGIRTASVDGAKPATRQIASPNDPVDKYASDGKKFPSYIVDAPAELASTKPATNMRLTAPGGGSTVGSDTDVARVDSDDAVPVPHPLPAWRTATISAGATRPATTTPIVVTAPPATTTATAKLPVPSAATTAPATTAVAATAPATAGDAPLIIDEELVARREAAIARVLDQSVPAGIVTNDELEDWDSGSLADYLERKGLLSDGGNQQASADSDDEGGYWLDERDEADEDRRLIRRVERRPFFFF